VAVPNLVGNPRAAASEVAGRLGFAVRADSRSSDDPVGTVLEQIPRAGALVGDGSTITLVLSSGPPPVAVPAVGGLTVDDASAQLSAAGFVVNVTRRFDEQVPKNSVINTDPPDLKTAPRDSVVTIAVSDGPAPIAVPDVAGKTFDVAAQTLSAQGFTAARADVFSDSVPAGQVVGTDPSAGSKIARGSKVAVSVSKGPELVAVPNVVGLAVEAASQKLQSLGLVPDVSNYGPGKKVQAQAPAGGQVKKGSTVRLFL